MNNFRSGSGAAVLAGSLAAVPLLEVLHLLGRTQHSGELQVVADGVEAHLRLEHGDLLGHPGVAAERLFDLACLDDAWFTVTASLTARRESDGAERIDLGPLLANVAPRVAEWRELLHALPFGAVARMAPAMRGPEAQIRSDQWRVLSLIGTGRPVHEVVDVSELRPLETLRLVRELAQEELIAVELPRPRTGGTTQSAPEGAAGVPGAIEVAGGEGDGDGRPDRGVLDPEQTAAEAEIDEPGGSEGPTGADGPVEPDDSPGASIGDPPDRQDGSGTPLRFPLAHHDGEETIAVDEASGDLARMAAPLSMRRPAPRRTVRSVPSDEAHAAGTAAAATSATATSSGTAASTGSATSFPSASTPAQAAARGTEQGVGAFMPPPVTPTFWPVLTDPGAPHPDGGDAVAAAAVVADAALAGAVPTPDGTPPGPDTAR